MSYDPSTSASMIATGVPVSNPKGRSSRSPYSGSSASSRGLQQQVAPEIPTVGRPTNLDDRGRPSRDGSYQQFGENERMLHQRYSNSPQNVNGMPRQRQSKTWLWVLILVIALGIGVLLGRILFSDDDSGEAKNDSYGYPSSDSTSSDSAVVSYSGAASTSGGSNTNPYPLAAIQTRIIDTIAIGAPKYNAGNIRGCFDDYLERVYRTYLFQSRTSRETLPGNVRMILEEELWNLRTIVQDKTYASSSIEINPSASSDDFNLDAWTMRSGFDRVLALSAGTNPITDAVALAQWTGSGSSTSAPSSSSPTATAAPATSATSPPSSTSSTGGSSSGSSSSSSGSTGATSSGSTATTATETYTLLEIHTSVENAISIGAPLYNSGDIKGCYDEYYKLVVDLLQETKTLPTQVKTILVNTRDSLTVPNLSNPTQGDYTTDAWTLRGGFDTLLVLKADPITVAQSNQQTLPAATAVASADTGSGGSTTSSEYYRFSYSALSITNDGVMGGLSSSSWSTSTALASGESIVAGSPNLVKLANDGSGLPTLPSATHATFKGTVRTENNGGFASARYYSTTIGSLNTYLSNNNFRGFWVAAKKLGTTSASADTAFELSVQQTNVGQYIMVFDVAGASDFQLYKFDWTPSKGESWTKVVNGWRRQSTYSVPGFDPSSGSISELSFYAIKPRIAGEFGVVIGGFGVYK